MIRYLGGLRKEIHHVKVLDGDQETYEPTMVILNDRCQGRSFQIPLGAMWKYVDPSQNRDEVTRMIDLQDFQKIANRASFRARTAVVYAERARAAADLACCAVAEIGAKTCGIMLCTAWNLAKCMQMFDITPVPPAMAQLLLWIQKELDDLRKFPEHNPKDDVLGTAGEVSIFEGGKRIATKEVQVTATDLAEEQVEVKV